MIIYKFSNSYGHQAVILLLFYRSTILTLFTQIPLQRILEPVRGSNIKYLDAPLLESKGIQVRDTCTILCTMYGNLCQFIRSLLDTQNTIHYTSPLNYQYTNRLVTTRYLSKIRSIYIRLNYAGLIRV